MNLMRRKIAPIVMALTFCLSSFSFAGVVQAAPYESLSDEIWEEAYNSSGGIYETMLFILEGYAGDDVSVKQLYDAAMRGMLESLDDYSTYFTNEEFNTFTKYFGSENEGLGIAMQYEPSGNLQITRIFEGSSAALAGIQKGDIIVKVNGKKIKNMYYEDIEKLLVSGKDYVKLTITRKGVNKEMNIKYGTYKIPTVFVNKISDKMGDKTPKGLDKVRYVEMISISDDTAKEFKTAIDKMTSEGVEKIILDLRGNGGGHRDVAIEICNMIVPKGVIMTSIDKAGKKEIFTSKLEKDPFKKIIVLTDSNTASAAEVIAGALQDSKAATIIGETTYGKGLVQSLYELEGGSAIKMTTEQYLRRSGDKVNGIGIIPNVKVDMIRLDFEEIDVKIGEKDAGLVNVKKALNFLGYTINTSDNVQDAATVAAVKKYQTDKGLKSTGEIDYTTLFNLGADLYTYYFENDVVFSRAVNAIAK